METSKLKQFAQYARRFLRDTVSTKLNVVLAQESPARRENPKAIDRLEKQIKTHGEDQVVERIAYTWFNRFCALRFMDVNRYHRTSVLSPVEGQFQPEILAEVKMGAVDQEMIPQKTAEKITGLLQNTIPSQDPQNEAYRLIVVSVCNFWHKTMPFLFQRIDDHTELLMPDDLLSGNSIISYVREAMTSDACKDVEIIGWLYQFYISEKKDEVFAGLKKNKKVTPENIPAATQLFTPNWIVRYLVENSLGRLWMLNHPGSRLIDRMEYYIKPEQEETDFLVIQSPEEIKICDPACGSGHMLVYAFEILYAIYEEQGYDAPKIPQLILKNNLYGIEIDERAGELAAFALCMKARGKYRRFFRKGIQPNVCVLKNVTFGDHEVKSYLDAVNPDLFTIEFSTLLYQFKEADNFGSLIRPELTNISDVLRLIDDKEVADDMFLQGIHNRVLKVLEQAKYLSPKYHIVIANPPYMGSKGMNERLGKWARDNYPISKSDLFAMFIDRNLLMTENMGMVAMITMQSWMFLSSFKKFRVQIIDHNTILSMAHVGARGFDSIGGEVVQTTAFVLEKNIRNNFKGSYLRLVDGNSETDKEQTIFDCVKKTDCNLLFFSNAHSFKQIPGIPIAYWLTEPIIDAFDEALSSENSSQAKKGITTGDNSKFIRFWWEVSSNRREISKKVDEHTKFKPHAKGGERRKWFGNHYEVLAYDDDSVNQMKQNKGFRHDGVAFFGKQGITWSDVTSGGVSVRLLPEGFTFNNASPAAFFSNHTEMLVGLSLINSSLGQVFLNILNPTIHFNPGDFGNIPIKVNISATKVPEFAYDAIIVAKNDWDFYEISWDYTSPPLLNLQHCKPTIKSTYRALRAHLQKMTLEMQRFEEENNRIFINAYGLQDELPTEVPLSEITLTCNPHYRYRKDKSEEEQEALLLADTMRELISYAVGCMFGRYSLDKPGLILANQGDTLENYLAKILDPTFKPDDDNVIPIMDVDWFPDDIVERFKRFLKVIFGEELYTENLEFIEKAIGKDIRKFFLKDFYTYHIKMYKKRPIYWMFSSPKGNFNALIYMHRYKSDTASIVLNDYLREFRTKLTARKDNLENISISTSASQGDKTKALKEIEKIKKVLDEIDGYERDTLYPLATKQIEIDLDDGVKVNYPKFGTALKKVAGLS